MMRFFFVFILSIAVPSLSMAQSSKYSTWSDPTKSDAQGQNNAELKTFKDRLNKLVDDAEKARAADPAFLKDLRALAGSSGSYNTPTLRTIFSDAFDDGNYTQSPSWNVVSGAYFIENGWGLRNKILDAGQAAQTETKSNSGEDLAIALLGSILNQATGGQQQQAAPAAQTQENLITSTVRISNAFAITLDVSSWVANGHFETGVFQGSNASTGYRLLYQTGLPLQLIKVGSSGRTVIAQSNAALSIEDKKFHAIKWSRDANGQMNVLFDGTNMINVTDRSFSDPFDGIRISDQGGDFIVKSVTIDGI